ncbi:MAG TPA: molybdopterin-dependent oxidoreductase [Acetobacteraceae bacterium]|jgi:hypothetical protein|nr:molybdopterin-dependent oxidoreductase [Acetobacteraceae bacterium]
MTLARRHLAAVFATAAAIGVATGVPAQAGVPDVVALRFAAGEPGHAACLPTALHPQTIMAFKLPDEILPQRYGYPFKIRIPTKLGFKNPKFVTTIWVTNNRPRGFRTDRGYNWFIGIENDTNRRGA